MRITYIQDQEIYQFGMDYYHAKSNQFFARYLAGMRDNETLTVLCGIIKVQSKEEVKNYQKITNSQIEYKKLPDFRSVKNLIAIYRQVKKETKNSDFCYLRCGIASSIAAYVCNKNRIPYMSIVNEDIYINCKMSSKLIVKLSAYPLWFGTRYAIKNAKYSCYVTREYLQQRYPTKGVSLGCSDVESLELNDCVLQQRMCKLNQMNPKECIIGTAGSVDAFLKAHDVVIKALKILNENSEIKYYFEIVGTGNPQRLRNIAKLEGVEQQVRFLGEMSHGDVLKWMDHLDIYVHPSRSEGLPRTIIEAISRATPCICSNVGGISELVDSDFLFTYGKANEPTQLAELLCRMDRSEMKRQAEINYKNAYNYNPEKLEARRKDFFESAIDKERRV